MSGPSKPEPDRLEEMAAGYRKSFRTGWLDAFGWAYQHVPAAREQLLAEALRRHERALVEAELLGRGFALAEGAKP